MYTRYYIFYIQKINKIIPKLNYINKFYIHKCIKNNKKYNKNVVYKNIKMKYNKNKFCYNLDA